MSFWSWLFPSIKRDSSTGIPGDHKVPHDQRDDEEIDPGTGIAIEDGQIVGNISIDPKIQEKKKGFDVPDPENP